MATAKSFRLIGLRSFWAYLKPHRPKLLFVFVLFTIASGLLAVIPVFIGQLIQTLSEPQIDSNRGWLLAWVLVGLSSSHDILWRCGELAYRKLLNPLPFLYENQLFQVVISKPFPYFVDKLTGKINSYLSTLGTEFAGLLNSVLFSFSAQIVSIVAILFIFGSLNWQTLTIFAIGLVGMYFVGRITLRYDMKYQAEFSDTIGTTNGRMYDTVTNFASVKAFHTEWQEWKVITGEFKKSIDATQKAFLMGILFWGSMSLFIRHFMWPLVILLNVYFFFHGQMTIGELATLLSTILIFANTVWEGVWYVSQFSQQMARIDTAHTYLLGDTILGEPTRDLDTPAPKLSDRFTLRDVAFAYPDKADHLVLQGISLDIKKGEKIGIVGHSGGGKSTIVKLLLDFYPLTSGAIEVDGQEVSSQQFARLVSYVPQDTSLFHRSIRENIAYGVETDDLKIIERAAKQASADEFIRTLPDGYDTEIGERGVKLSGGQRQRIAIARAMLQNKPILILDEATSALDSESELKVQQALDTLWQDKTVIAIAHRLSTLRHMDRIVVIEHGTIKESGTHAELLKKKGTYAKLWTHQSGGFIEE